MAPPTTPTLTTPLCPLLSITTPILLAGMARCSTAPLAAAVSNAGGLGCLGGLGYTPSQLQTEIQELKSLLRTPNLPFAIDLALPAVGGSARKTNHDYTHGALAELVEIIIAEGTRVFVSAVGVPPAPIIERLHGAGVLVMNMLGHPRHARKALDAGVDLVCAQGGEGGGHTGEIPMHILVPAVVRIAKGYKPPLLKGAKAMVIAAGGIASGSSLAAALMLGAVGVWIGTAFVVASESGASRLHKQAVLSAGWEDTLRTLVVSGRPLRVKRNEYIAAWEERPQEIRALTERGVVPLARDMDEGREEVDLPFLMGQVAAVVEEVRPAGEIMEGMVREAVERLGRGEEYIGRGREVKL
ncbi:MAG: hypothetical protein M1817_003613 [Caeruleum heppii]|nr:MAG: hypothetical protein M1817_003613 [Caeruleum heppii]